MKQNSHDAGASAWLTKTEALRALEISERSLDRLVTAGKVEKQTRPRQDRTPEPIYNRADVDRLTAREAFAIEPAGPDAKQLAPSPAAPSLPGLPAFFAVLDQLASPRRPAHAPDWLDLDAATAHSGLSARLLRSLIRAGQLPALKDGRSWKVRRLDLAAIRAPAPAASGADRAKRATPPALARSTRAGGGRL